MASPRRKTRPRLSTRLERGDVFAEKCPSREILSHVTSKWGVLVLVALLGGTHRFSELRRKIDGVSERMLAETLQKLERDSFVKRIAFPVVPPHVEYSLTPLGKEIGKRVEGLADWIEKNVDRIQKAQTRKDGRFRRFHKLHPQTEG
jgi:DNA-binding HxlR family transcriptional regulator